MKSSFSENIKALRRERRITQEQFAEVMGVSAGAIYKWEQAISTPDIEVIMEIAGFFGVSVDALVGYRMCSNDRDRILQELKRIKLEKSYESCWDEVEKWLRRYPNDFDIVYAGGVLYTLSGIETGDRTQLLRSVDLLSHACTLIAQNRDPKLSETELHRDIAIAYLAMGEWEKGIEQLKANNPCGIHDDIIGQELAANPRRRSDALPYLTSALLRCTASLYRIVIGFVNLFVSRKDYASAIEILSFMSRYLSGLKTEQRVSFLDKDHALLLALCGAVYQKTGESGKAREYLRKARQIAVEFDAAPSYTSRNIRYCENAEPSAAYDNIGRTAMDSISNVLAGELEDPEESLLGLWEEICHETSAAP